MPELKWKLHEEPLLYKYMHHRVIRTRFGPFKETEAVAHREAEVQIERSGPCLQLVLFNIKDTGFVGERIEKPLDQKRYPLIEINEDGEVTHNFYPANDRFPVIFAPKLKGLSEGRQRGESVTLQKLKVGFRKLNVDGQVTTEWRETEEVEGRKLAVLVTKFDFQSPKPVLVRPTAFFGESVYKFDIDRGCLATGEVDNELRQSIGFANVEMKMRMELSVAQG